ncbi:MAG: gamma-glutamylcyclotransferase [Deltaproteobacteria bacterium]
MGRKVWTFFYGSFVNPQVLNKADVLPANAQRGRLDGWDIIIEPRATLRPSDKHCVYGILAKVSHADLDKLYSKDWFGFGAYLPEAVNIAIDNGRYVPAMCYIAWEMERGKATREYIGKIVEIAEKYAFPRWYIDKVMAFAPD